VLLGAVLDEAALVALLDELEVQRHHLLLQLGDAGLHRGDAGEQLLRLQCGSGERSRADTHTC
jgi:hypothetical protein